MVKTSSGKDAFESESSVAQTEFENEGNDATFSEYEATARESSYSDANSQSQLTLETEHGDTSITQSTNDNRSASTSSAFSETTKIAEDSARDNLFNDDDFEMMYSSTSGKSEKSSSSSSYSSDSKIDDKYGGVQQKSSSYAETKEFESEAQQSSFVSLDIDNSEDLDRAKEFLESGSNSKTSGKKISLEELEEKQKAEENVKSTTSTKPGPNTHTG